MSGDKRTADSILKKIESNDSAYWSREGKRSSFALFQSMAKRVPAYKDFLKEHKIDPGKIQSFGDLSYVPPISKDIPALAPEIAPCKAVIILIIFPLSGTGTKVDDAVLISAIVEVKK